MLALAAVGHRASRRCRRATQAASRDQGAD